ncbi:MAG: von Willebrand factor type A domain-containing protein [Bacteroidales bacterium]|nr:von Willebrand factor type A domain-containing protein [Bacteroidales bacterium]
MKAITSFFSVLVLSVMLMSAGTPRVITGKVVDETGAALAGVNVIEKGTHNGTLTDIQGNYSLHSKSPQPVLVFSFIGMETREIQPGASNTLNVTLTASAMELEEVVVIDAGSQKHVALCGAVAEVAHNRGRKSMHYAATAMPAYYAPQQDWNTESYSTIHENGFKDVLHNPLSTFSIDVDRASYSNIRRFINMGQQPPIDAVRIEEMINYFSYDYPEPDGEHPFSVTTELSTCPWNTSHQLLHVGLQGKHIDKDNLPPSNLVFLVDVSGSMNAPNKLPLLKSAFRLLVNELRPQDRVAMVVYAGAAGTVLESTPGSQKTMILEAMDKLQAGGSTAGGAGLKLAYKTAEEHFMEDGNNRIILATDGDFNIGQSSDAEMERLIEQKREKGIFITVLGFGMGNYKDSKMETIADKGNGNYAYIDNVQEANKVLVSEFGGTLFTIAKDVKFQIEFNPARVKGYRLVGYENRLLNDEDFNDDTKDAGEMGAGHTVTALYELIPAGAEGEVVNIDPLKYQSNRGAQGVRVNSEDQGDRNRDRSDRTDDARTYSNSDRRGNTRDQYADELMTIKLRYKQPDGATSTKVEIPVKGKLEKFENTSDDFRFAAAVAEYGMILRGSDYLEQGSIAEVLEMARGARGDDNEGYRGEFIKIVRTTESLLAAQK